jgi:hypothetical protein
MEVLCGLARTSSHPMKVMDLVVECLEMMSFSPQPKDADYGQNGVLPATCLKHEGLELF